MLGSIGPEEALILPVYLIVAVAGPVASSSVRSPASSGARQSDRRRSSVTSG
jgi:hypothetical protein